MASIIKKTKKGRHYYYAVESKRVDGKPRIVWQKYLGTLDKIVERAEGAKPPPPKETVIFQAGGVAALLRIAQRLGLLEIINQAVPKRNQGPSVGHYLLLAALNRALEPCSKLAIGAWYEKTVLRRLWRFPNSAFSSQRFWDHMDMVSEEAIEQIQDALLPKLRQEFAIDARLLLYDTTNFFTFLATSNHRAKLPQRGHAKSKRHDLRIVGLALLVTRDFQVPLLHRTYAGNIIDVTLFPEITMELVERYRMLSGNQGEITLALDKGHVGDDAMDNLIVGKIHFVAALPSSRFHDVVAAPLDRFESLPGLPGTRAFTATTTQWAKECRLVAVYTESFFTQQLSGLTHDMVKCQKKLLDLKKRLDKRQERKCRGPKPTVRSVEKAVRGILSAQFMDQIFEISVKKKNDLPYLRYAVDHAALQRITTERLGRNLLITDRLDWSPEQVVKAHRTLSAVEDAFKHMKNPTFLRWQPAWHWTDQKLRVHGLYCVLALLLATLARQEASRAGVDLSLPALLSELSDIREVAVIYPPGTLAHRKDHVALSRMSPRQRKLAETLSIGEILVGGRS